MRFLSPLLLCLSSIALSRVAPARPLITAAPTVEEIELRRRQDGINLGSLAGVLVTAVPPSLLALAETNLPALSRLLWSEFLDNNTPSWFTALPTDVQDYLSGQFGPSTAASNSASSPLSGSLSILSSSTIPSPLSSQSTSVHLSASSASATQAANNQVDSTQEQKHQNGLSLRAKALIGVLVPVLVFGLLGLILLCCWRRRLRRRRAARAQSSAPPLGGHGPIMSENNHTLRGGLFSHADTDKSKHTGSYSSDEYTGPIGGPSYENITTPTAATAHVRRSSRHSSSSLQSVQELPEPTHNRYPNSAPIPFPPRSPRRSRDLNPDPLAAGVPPLPPINHNSGGMTASKRPGLSYNQAHYAGSFNPYSNPIRMDIDESPFLDPLSPYEAGRVAIGGRRQSIDHDHENQSWNRSARHDAEDGWPLRAHDNNSNNNSRRHSVPRKPLPHGVYERVYE